MIKKMTKKSIVNLFWLNWIKNFETNKYVYKFLIYFFVITTIIFIWILWLILPLIYLGIQLQRKHFYTILLNKFAKIKNRSYILYIFIRSLLIIIVIMLVLMIFPLVILSIIFIGVYFEQKKTKIKISKNPYSIESKIENMKKHEILTYGKLRK